MAIVQAPDFSGTWELDREASRITSAEGLAGLGGGGSPEFLHVTQAANGALIISSRVNAAQPRSYEIGGSSVVPASEGATMVVTTRWDGDRLISEGAHEADDGSAVGIREVLTLGADGQTLTLEVTTKTGAGDHTNTLVYRKVG